MNAKIVVAAVAIIAIVVLAVVAIALLPSEPIPTPTDFGEWGSDIIVEFTDDSTESLNQILRFPLAVGYSGKYISTITYKLSGRTRDEGSGDIEIDLNAFCIDVLTKEQDVTVNTVTIESSGYKSFPADGQWHMVWQSTEKCDVNLFFPSGIGVGEYDMAWMPNGTLKYSTDGIEWISEVLPGNILLKGVELTTEGHVTVSFSSEIEVE